MRWMKTRAGFFRSLCLGLLFAVSPGTSQPLPQYPFLLTIVVQDDAALRLAGLALRTTLWDRDALLPVEDTGTSFSVLLPSGGRVTVLLDNKQIPPHHFYSVTLLCLTPALEEAEQVCTRLATAIPRHLIILPPPFQRPPAPSSVIRPG